jgi:hypothetical protein
MDSNKFTKAIVLILCLIFILQCAKIRNRVVIQDFALDTFERIRDMVAPEDETTIAVEFIDNYVKVSSQQWVYILDNTGQQIFKPINIYPHIVGSFSKDISPILDEWKEQPVSEDTINMANELALSIFGKSYIYPGVGAKIGASRELIVSKAADAEMVKHYEGRTMVNFIPLVPDDLTRTAYESSIINTPDGLTLTSVKPLDSPPRAFETGISFSPEGHLVRAESTFQTPEVQDIVDYLNEDLERGIISRPVFEYEPDLRFGSFFGGHEWRFELTAYSWESEQFLDPTQIGVCLPGRDNYYDECNPYYPYDSFEWCHNAFLAPDVNTYIRQTQWYKYDFWREWSIFGKTNGIRGNWLNTTNSWEIDTVSVVRHQDLSTYDVVGGTTLTGPYKTCEPVYLTVPRDDPGTLNVLEQEFYDDLEACHVAMINTHGGYAWCDISYQFQSKPDVWVSLHREGDDGLGRGNLRHLFLLTCSSMQWNHGPKHGESINLFSDWMNGHIADGIRTICGYDAGSEGYHSNGFKFFESYRKGDSISQSWFNMGLKESLRNIPVVVSYGTNEAEAATTLFDGKFTKTRGGTGWIIAAELITDHLVTHQACCLPEPDPDLGTYCINVSVSECISRGGIPQGNYSVCGDHCPWYPYIFCLL